MRELQDNNHDRFYSLEFEESYEKLLFELASLYGLMEKCENAAGKLIGKEVSLLISSDLEIYFVANEEDAQGGHEMYCFDDIFRAILDLVTKHTEYEHHE